MGEDNQKINPPNKTNLVKNADKENTKQPKKIWFLKTLQHGKEKNQQEI